VTVTVTLEAVSTTEALAVGLRQPPVMKTRSSERPWGPTPTTSQVAATRLSAEAGAASTVGRIAKKRAHGARHGRPIPVCDDQAGLTHHLAQRGVVEDGDRRAGGHRLERRQAEALVRRGKQKAVGQRIEAGQVLTGDVAEDAGVVADARVVQGALDGAGEVALEPGDHQPHVMVGAQPPRHLGNQFDALARVERAHGQDEPRREPEAHTQVGEVGIGDLSAWVHPLGDDGNPAGVDTGDALEVGRGGPRHRDHGIGVADLAHCQRSFSAHPGVLPGHHERDEVVHGDHDRNWREDRLGVLDGVVERGRIDAEGAAHLEGVKRRAKVAIERPQPRAMDRDSCRRHVGRGARAPLEKEAHLAAHSECLETTEQPAEVGADASNRRGVL